MLVWRHACLMALDPERTRHDLRREEDAEDVVTDGEEEGRDIRVPLVVQVNPDPGRVQHDYPEGRVLEVRGRDHLGLFHP